MTKTRLGNLKRKCALSEDRTHDLQITLVGLFLVIMRLTRYLLRYQGTYYHLERFHQQAQIVCWKINNNKQVKQTRGISINYI